MKTINCFVPFASAEQAKATVEALKASELVKNVYLLKTAEAEGTIEGCEAIDIKSLYATDTIKKIAEKADADYVLLYTKYDTLVPGMFAIERMEKLASDSSAAMVYADHYQVVDGKQTNAPVIDYQFGSLRDDFDFGSVLMFNAANYKEAAAGIDKEYEHAGLYDLRLRISRLGNLVHINE